jgi:hypothetical protein
MLELLLNPHKRKARKGKAKARRTRKSRKFVTIFTRRHKRVSEKRWAKGTKVRGKIGGGRWTNPMAMVGTLKSRMTHDVLPLAAGVVANMLLRPKIQDAIGITTPSIWKNAAVGVGSAALLGIVTGLVARQYAGKVVIGALVQTAITTAIEAKAAHTVATTPAVVVPVLPAPVKAAGLGWEDDGLASYSPEYDAEPM